MALYGIADLHLSLGVNKPMDVFRGWENYVERLKQNWEQTVKPEDTVVLAGDISWGLSLSETEKDFRFIDALPGKKILLKGNHDLWFSTKSKVERFWETLGVLSLSILFNNAYHYGDYAICGTRGWINGEGAGDKKVLLRECGRLRTSLEAGRALQKEPLVFLHYPPIYGGDECEEILEILMEYEVKRVYYGHIHGYSAGYALNGSRHGIEFRLISGDFLQFQPTRIV